MKITATPLVALACLFLLPGCATKLSVTYDSDPPGAVLYQGQQRFGYTPYTLDYILSDEDESNGYKLVAGTSARWASGASIDVPNLRADLKRFGLSQVFTFRRPAGFPGLEVDNRFALELERTRALQRQATAQEDQAWAQLRQARAQEERASAERMKNYFPPKCTTVVVGNVANTVCN